MSLCADAYIVKIKNSIEPLYEKGDFEDQKFIMADRKLFHRFAGFAGDRWDCNS